MTVGEAVQHRDRSAGSSSVFVGAQYLDRRSAWSNDPCAGMWPIAVGDLTGDGVADIVWADTATATLSAWVLDGAGHVVGPPAVHPHGARQRTTPAHCP
jgi:hypothetical protein